ncbi:aldose 1-epimerase [Paenibacillus sp. J22TS3]|uniref:aldose 1-epimerase n=1 Tax=Paenibacillus sp. J22TS3 TaxID=2807192 RepID=UPI001B1A2B9A|nr:aldose 1-epimerase [Paenibacillus sp. J22TS3]GIP21337.1 galactose mutarotase [Paenibacillus sp. J22TS3]
MAEVQAYQGDYQSEEAVWLKAGTYEAVLLPRVGGNLIAFRDTKRNYRFLREPREDEMDTFRQGPGTYGIPVLFPPNRYEDGKFPWNGKTYQFPINEPATGNHLHGFLHTIPWEVEQIGQTERESFATVKVTITREHPVYEVFPFEFTVKLRYTLGPDGLSQLVTVKNEGAEPLPCLIAFHTAINAPFVQGGEAKDYLAQITIGQRWELNERMLPTGKHQPLSPEEEKLKQGGVNPFFGPMDNHYTAAPQGGRNRMELTDTKHGVTLVYDVGTSYKMWMVWNNGATEGFFCPEPQMNLVNAPKVNLPAEEIGLISLAPGEIWEETARLYTKE